MEIEFSRFDIDNEVAYTKRQIKEIAESYEITIPEKCVKRSECIDFLRHALGVKNIRYKINVGDLLVKTDSIGCSSYVYFYLVEKITDKNKYRVVNIDGQFVEDHPLTSGNNIGRSTVIIPKMVDGKYIRNEKRILISSELRYGKSFFYPYESSVIYADYRDYGD